MKLLSISLAGYRQFREPSVLEIPSGIVGICGPNGVGKSKLIEALGYCLYGPHARVLPSGDKASDVPSKGPGDSVPMSVAVRLEVNGQTIEIVRTGGAGTLVRLEGEEPLASGLSPVTAKVQELLCLTADAFHSTCVARQREVALLQSLKAVPRRKVINRLIGITAFEEALKESGRECADREKVSDDLSAKAATALKEAEDDVTFWQSELNEAAIEESQKRQEKEAANTVWEKARDMLSKAEAEAFSLAQLREEIARLDQLINEGTSNLDSLRRHLGEVREAAQFKVLAESILDLTRDSESNLEFEANLERRNGLWLEERELQVQLEHFQHQLQTRESLAAEIEADDQVIEFLRTQLLKSQLARGAAEAAANAAEDEKTLFEQHYKTAHQLGEDGRCEICGQQFRDNLGNALARYEASAGKAEDARCDALAQAQEAQSSVTEIETQINEVLSQRSERFLAQAEYESAAVHQSRTLEIIERVQHEIAQISVQIPEVEIPYDRWLHEQLVSEVEARDVAQSLLNKYGRQALSQDALEMSMQRADQELQQHETERGRLESEIEKITAMEEELGALRAHAADTQSTFDNAQSAFESALQQLATARANFKSAQQQELRARQLKTTSEQAHFHWQVAAQTQALLRQMLDEIINEARPRLSQLLEGWAHRLLGAHFREIVLDEEYSLKADNGSGLHDISHFSGGEQTLLAVMMRVAIAIYCQERAGFETGFLVLDEVFGDQDALHREQLLQFLQEISSHFHQILLVNHIENVTDQLDSHIEVQEIGTKSSRAFLRF